MNKIEQLERKLEEMHKEIAELKAEQEAKGDNWPQRGDEYWSGIRSTHNVLWLSYEMSITDEFSKAIGDMHRTKEEAEAYRAYRMNPRTVMRDKIQMWVDEYNGGELGKFIISSGGNVIKDAGLLNPLATKDSEGAELLKEKFGLDNIMWACGEPEPSDGK